jgi:hypothetical protein
MVIHRRTCIGIGEYWQLHVQTFIVSHLCSNSTRIDTSFQTSSEFTTNDYEFSVDEHDNGAELRCSAQSHPFEPVDESIKLRVYCELFGLTRVYACMFVCSRASSHNHRSAS